MDENRFSQWALNILEFCDIFDGYIQGIGYLRLKSRNKDEFLRNIFLQSHNRFHKYNYYIHYLQVH